MASSETQYFIGPSREYARLRRRQFAILLLATVWFLLLFVPYLVLDRDNAFVRAIILGGLAIGLIPCWIGVVLTASAIASWRCPRCGGRFTAHRSWRSPNNRCTLCGLQLPEGESKENPRGRG